MGRPIVSPPHPLKQHQGWQLRIVKRRQRAFKITGLTWIVERSFAWLGRNRRLSKDYEYRMQTSETMIDLAAIRLKGRVASLLEVGTGFHPELTGRENIYLNGSILGMSRAEIKAKFDEIVGFAETEKFLDTPVKRYSSGMYVRLAFAVAAHLEPEILIVDEVLAVGDAAFQKKCLGKLQDVAGQDGRTVLFVSHNLNSILRLCSRALWLDAGSLREMGRPADIVHAYSQQRSADSRVILLSERRRPHWARQNSERRKTRLFASAGLNP